MNVALVNMPFYGLEAPSHALGLLKSHLKNSNISSTCLNLNYTFAHKLGIDNYLSYSSSHSFGADQNWCFARKAFGDSVSPNNATIGLLTNCIAGFEELIPLRLKCERFIDELCDDPLWQKYDLIGFTVSSVQMNSVFALGRLLKKLYPEKYIVCGGSVIYGDAGVEFIKKFQWLDFAFTGEADKSFPDLIKRLEGNIPLEGLKNVAYRKQNKIVHNDSAEKIDLNDVPIPDYSEYIEEVKNCPKIDPIIPMEWARGCYYGNKKCCTFCADVGLAKNQYKYRTPKNALKYLKEIVTRYPESNIFHLTDPLVQSGFIEHILEPWSKIKPKGKNLFMECKPWFRRKDVRKMKKAGVHAVQIGVESLHPKILKLLKKGDTITQCLATLKWLTIYDISAEWNYLWRVPGEKQEWYFEIYELLKKIVHLHPPLSFGIIMITKNSPYWEEREQFNFQELHPLDVYHHILPRYLDFEQVAWYYQYNDEYYKGSKFVGPATPGHKIVQKTIEQWKEDYENLRPKLEFTDEGILDTRRGANISHSLTQLQRQICLYCDTPRSLKSLKKVYGEIDSELELLMEISVFVNYDNKFTSLISTTDEDLEMLEIVDQPHEEKQSSLCHSQADRKIYASPNRVLSLNVL